MKKIAFILLCLCVFSCSDKTKEFKEKRKSIKSIERELLDLTKYNYNTFIGLNENVNIEEYSKHLTKEYKEYLCREAQMKNVDSVLTLSFQLGKSLMDDLRKKGAKISNGEFKIAEKRIQRDTLVYLIKTELIMTVESTHKKLTSTDYVLTISNNYGLDWYYFQADIPEIKNLISYRLDKNMVKETISMIGRHKPNSKTEKLQ